METEKEQPKSDRNKDENLVSPGDGNYSRKERPFLSNIAAGSTEINPEKWPLAIQRGGHW